VSREEAVGDDDRVATSITVVGDTDFMRPRRDPVRPGMESVWDYPRPPRLEPVERRIRVEFGGFVIVDTTAAYRVLETSHPPNYYVPPGDIRPGSLVPSSRRSFCEWKGQARYFDVRASERVESDAAWCYDHPTAGFGAIAGYVAFYAGRMDACFVDDERVVPQPGGFYGGWVTADLAGPFKGISGSAGW
jgi:uncharacterized protein (DUF427 family)